ncbi:GPALPP motifs-containing protein 1 [Danio rerio]|uniref:GPALPP motifs-containing protein 1 n=1 Tax=Danio rerio TaxID=7955 RepID=Q6DBU2_DANRE|nr:GPALPP motifs-containing protein 1 [Danio rerio]AAH78362.1 Zgc:91844 [Danio rerio]|eukprot:NP_001003473.1 GPALPP motifs-containing protein 1 [Danio rerio]
MSDENVIGPALPPTLKKDENSDDDGAIIGPALPPLYKASESSSSCEDSDEEEVVFKRAKYSSSRNRSSSNSRSTTKDEMDIKQTYKHEDEEDFFGPALPPGFQKRDKSPDGQSLQGPALPPGFKNQDEDEAGAKEDKGGFSGPALPPGYRKRDKSPERPPAIGPALPPGFKRLDDNEEEEKDEAEGFSGPALPPGFKPDLSSSEEEEDDYVIGPMPSKGPFQDTVALDFERRAQQMKDKLTGVDTGPTVLSRESWMTELPPELQHVGLEARTFKKRTGPENKDRSIWTDTPADRERKARERQEAKEKGESAKDDVPRLSQKELEMADKISKYNESKRGESLISLHTKKMKRKAEEDAKKPVERRPFDRDADLQVNRFDEAQKKALLKKSAELNTRFSHSKDRMFL